MRLLPTEAFIADSQADFTLSIGMGGKVIKYFDIMTSFFVFSYFSQLSLCFIIIQEIKNVNLKFAINSFNENTLLNPWIFMKKILLKK